MSLRPLFIVILFFCYTSSYSQKVDSLAHKLDSMQKLEAKPENKPVINRDKEEYTSATNITFKGYFVLLGTDALQEVRGPFHASKKTWIKVGEFAAIETALFFAGDKPVQKFATNFMARNPGLDNASTYITNFGGAYEGYILAAFGAYGVIFKSNRVKTTTLLATQSYLTAAAMSYAVKYLTSRQRPNANDMVHEHPERIFKGPPILTGRSYSSGTGSSFPSGHTTAAFSAATVFAYEYKDKILIPIIAYSIASLVGISRITENAHWASDVFAGAALGYVTGKQVVTNYHRYARLRNAQQKRTSLLFNLNYIDGVVMPGVVYKF